MAFPFWLCLATTARFQAALSISPLFSDGAVVQRGRPIDLEGTAAPNAAVVVSLGASSVRAQASSVGVWDAKLPSHSTSFVPVAITVRSGGRTVVSRVLFGDVWICSGQSNMEFPLSESTDGVAVAAKTDMPAVHLFHVYHRTVDEPLSDVKGGWRPCDSSSARSFSAVGYYFGKVLQPAVDAPVGLIEADWGGTPIESWIPQSSFMADKAIQSILTSYQDGLPALGKTIAEYRASLAKRDQMVASVADTSDDGLGFGWQSPSFDDSKWRTIDVPGAWSPQLGYDFRGSAWYRTTFTVPVDWLDKSDQIDLGPLADWDDTFVNGTSIGKTGAETIQAYSVDRRYSIPQGLLHPGPNLLAVRVFGRGSEAGFVGDDGPRLIGPRGLSTPLQKQWKFSIESALDLKMIGSEPAMPLMPGNPAAPSSLFNGMVNPLRRLAVKGVLWYQGESNVGRASQYQELLADLMAGWRTAFGDPKMPFVVVQLPGFGLNKSFDGASQWAALREAQRNATLGDSNASLVVTIDQGAGDTIHPPAKREVGRRAALVALASAYRQSIPAYGPTLTTARRRGDSLILEFSHAEGGLRCSGSTLIGFAVKEPDGDWHSVPARISGSDVVIDDDDALKGKEVRYDWADNPLGDIRNGFNLPMAPFEAKISNG